MRPKTFPTGGSSQQMLQEIRNSLRNLSKPSDPPKVDSGAQGKMLCEDPRQHGRCPKNSSRNEALDKIKQSLKPFAIGPNSSGPDVNQHMLPEHPFPGFEEVR